MLSILCLRSIRNASAVFRQLAFNQERYYVTRPNQAEPPKSFITQLIQNIRHEMEESKELKESLAKFKEERDKLEQAESVKRARAKYDAIEKETSKGSEAIRSRLSSFKDRVKETLEDAHRIEALQKAGESISKAAESVKDIAKASNFSAVAETLRKELADAAVRRDSTVYKRPEKLTKRRDLALLNVSRTITPDEESSGVVVHKESKLYQAWQAFKDTNPYFNRLFEMKMKMDESDHVAVRMGRGVIDRFSSMFGSVFQRTELSTVMTEICKVDPEFDRDEFLDLCRVVIIPNVLEAIVRQDLEVLQDWCTEPLYRAFLHQFEPFRTSGKQMDVKILDLSNVDLAAGRIMEQGPVLIITFTTQEVDVLRDIKTGKIVEGDPDHIYRVNYVWALCRDVDDLDPKAAWRLMELSCNRTDQFL